MTVPIIPAAAAAASPKMSQQSTRPRTITIDQHTIQIAMRHATEKVIDPGYRRLKKRLPYYYMLMYEHAIECKVKGIQIDGVMCHACANLIPEGEQALSKAKRSGRKYFHISCAERLNLL